MERWNHMLYKLFLGNLSLICQLKVGSHFFQFLGKEDENNFVFLGGSMVLGMNCKAPPFIKEACAYSMRVGRLVDYLISDSSIDPYNIHDEYEPTLTISNLAVMGSNTKALVPVIPVMMENLVTPPSAVFIDFSVNDPFDFDSTTEASEALVRWLLETYPSTAIFFVEAFCMPKGKKTYGMHRSVAEHYNIPVFSYRSSVEKHCTHPALWGEDVEYHRALTHPPWPIHRNIAHSIVKALFSQRKCSNGRSFNIYPSEEPLKAYPLPPPLSNDLQAFKVCSPISFYSAYECFEKKKKCEKSGKVTNNKGWKLIEDRKHKPGWITKKGGASIDFNVQFGEEDPRLIIGFLRSYEKLGNASVYFPNEDTKYHTILNGFLNSHASQTVPRVIRNREVGMTDLSGLKTVVRITNISEMKIKIIYVITC